MDFGKLKYQLKEYLSFTKGERVGILVLISLIILVFLSLTFLPYFNVRGSSIDISKFEKQIAEFEKQAYSIDNKKDSLQKQKSFSPKTNSAHSEKENIKLQIDLNRADTADLERLPGIGPVFAKRILKYRTLLGGYYSVNQLYEVFGMKPETVNKIQNQLIVDTSIVSKINLNMDDFKKINAHPYISYEQTKALFKARKSNKINSIKQLQDLSIFTSEELLKLRHYLSFSD